MEKTKNRFGDTLVLHEMCSCGRGRAIFGKDGEGHCLHCSWSKTAHSRGPGEWHSRATYGLCPGCKNNRALYRTPVGRRCHWCRSEIRFGPDDGSQLATGEESQ